MLLFELVKSDILVQPGLCKLPIRNNAKVISHRDYGFKSARNLNSEPFSLQVRLAQAYRCAQILKTNHKKSLSLFVSLLYR
jgi:hypothetical protein